MPDFLTLGMETSCDETSVAVLEGPRRLLANVVASQEKIHAKFGGVVPEIAARKHTEVINHLIGAALDEAGARFEDLNLVAVTVGPGLAVSLVVGISAARALAYALNIPAVGVNHLEAHLLANCLDREDLSPPAVCLLVSGGHTEIVLVEEIGKYSALGATVDDAAGEAFDKVARLLGLGYPGGPVIQETAADGDPSMVIFPRPMIREDNFNFSFSGLKTAVLNFIRNNEEKIGKDITVNDLAASFQEAVVDVLVYKTIQAALKHGVGDVWLAGGVAANKPLRERFRNECDRNSLSFSSPDFILCTDNAGMVAKTGYESFRRNETSLPLSPQPGLNF